MSIFRAFTTQKNKIEKIFFLNKIEANKRRKSQQEKKCHTTQWQKCHERDFNVGACCEFDFNENQLREFLDSLR